MSDQQHLEEFFEHLSKAIGVLAREGLGGQPSTACALQPGALDIEAACEYLSVGKTSFHQIRKQRGFPKSFQLGGRPHWRPTDLDRWIDKQTKKD